MFKYSVRCVGTSPLLFGKATSTPKEIDETNETHELRVWRERAHVDESGHLQIPSYATKAMLVDSARYAGDKIKGAGQKTYSTKLGSGLRMTGADIPIFDGEGDKIHIDSVHHLAKFVPSDGQKRGKKRVLKHFPIVYNWQFTPEFIILDDIITADLMTKYLKIGGYFRGIGMWRPATEGDFGTFYIDEDSVCVTKVDV